MSGRFQDAHILVLEDEFLISMDVEQMCRDEGARDVTLARTLDEAQAALNGKPIDAAILDVMLGTEATYDFARILQAKRIPFVFASGYFDDDEMRNSFPGVKLVAKPYAGDDLMQSLQRACGKPAPRTGDETRPADS